MLFLRRVCVSLLALSACATPGGELRARIEAPEARVMFVGAHPDDESVAGAILARACIGLGRPCRFVILTRGGGGACEAPEGCHGASLEALRVGEMRASARAFGASLVLLDYPNAKLPWESFPTREKIAASWARRGDPATRVAEEIATFHPTVVLTFDPDHGFTGHPEHQLAARYAHEAVQRSPTPKPALFQVLNSFWLTKLLGRADPGPPTEHFDTHAECGTRRCLDVALAITHVHHTQWRSMTLVRALRPQMGLLPVRRWPD